MNFELMTDPKTETLLQEIELDNFLSLFDKSFPILPHIAIFPLSENEASAHFETLTQISDVVQEDLLDLYKCFELIHKLPFLDGLLPFFATKKLEQHHLFLLGKFLSEEMFIHPLESNYPLLPQFHLQLKEMLTILIDKMKEQFRSFLFSKEEEQLQKAIYALEEKVKILLTSYEEQIRLSTGVQLIYPYGKEISLDDPRLEKVKSCPLLKITRSEANHFYHLDFVLPAEIAESVIAKEKEEEKFQIALQKKLSEINNTLFDYYASFKEYYLARQKRVYHYILVSSLRESRLILPSFNQEASLQGRGMRLPFLEETRGDDYIPLSLDLAQGSNLLFGSNMSGKTTVLKTIFFHLWAIQRGLPVPADQLDLRFPAKIKMHLPSAGSLTTNLSGFGEEIDFFSNDDSKGMKPYTYILTDELFQSTNPIAGAKLSQIFLQYFSELDIVFFCTSQYPEVLKMKEIKLLRMAQKLEQNRYEIDSISDINIELALKENLRPLEIALKFSLPPLLKEKIKEAYRNQK